MSRVATVSRRRARPAATRRSPLARRVVVVAGFVLLATVIVLLHMRDYPKLSPIDELQHLDYIDSASRLDPVRPGETVRELAMREEACRGIDSPGFVVPDCKAQDLRPEQYQELGLNTASAHPPVYYVVTGMTAQVIDLVPGVDSFLTAGRAVGALWLGLGLAGTFLLARRIGASREAALGGSLLLAATPATLHSTAVVTNDAPSFLIGSLVVLAAVGVLRHQVSPVWLAGLAFLATSIKLTNSVVVGVAVLLLLVVPRPPRWRAAAVTLGAGLAPVVGWVVLSRLWVVAGAPEAPMTAQFKVDSIGAREILGNVFSVITPVQNPYTPAILQTPYVSFLTAVLNLMIVGALVAAAWFARRRLLAALALLVLGAMAAAGPVFVILAFVIEHSYFPVPSRYGLSLMPAAIAALAVVASRRRIGGRVLLGLGSASMVALLVALA